MPRYYSNLALTLVCMFWAVDALARGRGYGSGAGGFGIVLGIVAIGGIGYGIYWIHRRFPGLGPFLGGLVVIFSVSSFFAVVLRDMGLVDDVDQATLVLPFIAWGVFTLYQKLK